LNLLVAPRRDLRGLSVPQSLTEGAGADGKPVYAQLDLAEVKDLTTFDFQTDAHFTPYFIEGVDKQCRLRKEALAPIHALGGSVFATTVAIDLDLHHCMRKSKALTWDQVPAGTRAVLVAQAPIPWQVAYSTKHGLRFIYCLASRVPVGVNYEKLLAKFHAAYRAAELPVDESCGDWTHLYRAPRITREDGEKSWEAPWFWIESRLEDTDKFYIPDEEDLKFVEGEVKAPMTRVSVDEDEAHALLWSAEKPGELSPTGKKAEKLFRGSAVHPYLFGHTPFSKGGSRHDKLTKVVGIVVSMLKRVKWGSQELATALCWEATKLLEQDEPWQQKAAEMVASFWARDGEIKIEDEEAPPSSPPTDPPKQEESAKDEKFNWDEERETPLEADGDGKPYKTLRNHRRAIAQVCRAYYDSFADRYFVEGLDGYGPMVTKRAVIEARLLIEEIHRLSIDKGEFVDVFYNLAEKDTRHPVREYLLGLKWDGKPRIGSWLTDYLGVVADPFTAAIGRIFLVAATKRVFHPGCKFDEMLVLEGDQGTRKSGAIQALLPNITWYTDALPLNADPQRFIEATFGKWLIEVPELSGMRAGDVDKLKANLSRQTDRARLAWGLVAEDYPRQFVIFGTTNEAVYLKDNTGNRRFWPAKVAVTCKIEEARIEAARDQLWAEAVTAEAAGESIRLDPSLYELEHQHQEKRQTASGVIHEVLEEALSGAPDGFITNSDVRNILGEYLKLDSTLVETSKSLARLGWKSVKIGSGKNTQRGYQKGEEKRKLRVKVLNKTAKVEA